MVAGHLANPTVLHQVNRGFENDPSSVSLSEFPCPNFFASPVHRHRGFATMQGNYTTSNTFLFTSECVSDGHPEQDPSSKVACETAVNTGGIYIFGEITTSANIDIAQIARDVVRDIGFDDCQKGFDYKTCHIMVSIGRQSPDIALSVHLGRSEDDIAAGDQGMMFGYATDETAEMVPFTHMIATSLARRLSVVRRDGTLPWARPDAKTQVTAEYINQNGALVPVRIHTIVISTQHSVDVSHEKICSDLMQHVILPSVPTAYIDEKTCFHLNPSGRFVIGGPAGDAGVTGRKLEVDSYGGHCPHGGGAFSGKDSSKVDRSAAYACRWVAKSIVSSGLARRVMVQVSYAIGIRHPLSITVNSFGTGVISDDKLFDVVKQSFDLSPGGIVRDLCLKKPIFRATSTFGHFGRKGPNFTWEIPKPLNLPL